MIVYVDPLRYVCSPTPPSEFVHNGSAPVENEWLTWNGKRRFSLGEPTTLFYDQIGSKYINWLSNGDMLPKRYDDDDDGWRSWLKLRDDYRFVVLKAQQQQALVERRLHKMESNATEWWNFLSFYLNQVY